MMRTGFLVLFDWLRGLGRSGRFARRFLRLGQSRVCVGRGSSPRMLRSFSVARLVFRLCSIRRIRKRCFVLGYRDR